MLSIKTGSSNNLKTEIMENIKKIKDFVKLNFSSSVLKYDDSLIV